MLVKILTRTPIKYFIQSKCVCKSAYKRRGQRIKGRGKIEEKIERNKEEEKKKREEEENLG
jgi:hypothetical protein